MTSPLTEVESQCMTAAANERPRRPSSLVPRRFGPARLRRHHDPRVGAVFESFASWLPPYVASDRAANAMNALFFSEWAGAGAEAGWPAGDPREVFAGILRGDETVEAFGPVRDEAIDAAVRSFELGRPVLVRPSHEGLTTREERSKPPVVRRPAARRAR
jgi:hypothetical protein